MDAGGVATRLPDGFAAWWWGDDMVATVVRLQAANRPNQYFAFLMSIPFLFARPSAKSLFPVIDAGS